MRKVELRLSQELCDKIAKSYPPGGYTITRLEEGYEFLPDDPGLQGFVEFFMGKVRKMKGCKTATLEVES